MTPARRILYAALLALVLVVGFVFAEDVWAYLQQPAERWHIVLCFAFPLAVGAFLVHRARNLKL